MTEKKTAAKIAPTTQPAKSTALRANAIDGMVKDMTQSQKMAALATRSTMTAFTVKAFAGCGNALEESDIIDELQKAGNEVVGGNMGRVEKMLVNQAIALDNIFNNMAQRSGKQETFKGIEVLMRLALKAQAQARATAEALALLKNPQPYIRQANIANGHQQVNNAYAGTPMHGGTSSSVELCDQYAQAPSGAGNLQTSPNKLLEADHGQRLDIGAQSQASRVNPHLETVG